jgi:hypothetical protein
MSDSDLLGLCGTCTALEELEFNFAVNPELDAWWAKRPPTPNPQPSQPSNSE